jgi:hypothetical protein
MPPVARHFRVYFALVQSPKEGALYKATIADREFCAKGIDQPVAAAQPQAARKALSTVQRPFIQPC